MDEKSGAKREPTVPCDGWCADLGCDGACEHPEWSYMWGGRRLCKQCAARLEQDQKAWAWLTR